MKDINSVINKALTTFQLRKAEKLHPVFTAHALEKFARQRFEDLFFANTKYSEFTNEKSKFEDKLKTLRKEIKNFQGSDLRHIVLITADIKEIQKRTVENLKFFRNDVDNLKNNEDFGKVEERVKKLGSSGFSNFVLSKSYFIMSMLVICFSLF